MPYHRQKALLHLRLGHLHDSGIAKLSSLGVLGVPPNLHHQDLPFCEDCHLNKSTVSDIPRASCRSSDPLQPFEMVAVDLWGPMKVSAIGGYNWVLGTACFSSAYLMASLLRTKDESYVHFETFLCKVRSLGFSVKILRIDNDSVFLGNNFAQSYTNG